MNRVYHGGVFCYNEGVIETRRNDVPFVLQKVQPALMGLMDGSVSTMAPIFAAVAATRSSHVALVIGFSAAVGSGISMAFAEALSDTGELTGRGHPYERGVVVGIATFFGGIFHTLPFFIPEVRTALEVAFSVVGLELIAIAYIREHYFRIPLWKSALQVAIGGSLVLAAGILIGAA